MCCHTPPRLLRDTSREREKERERNMMQHSGIFFVAVMVIYNTTFSLVLRMVFGGRLTGRMAGTYTPVGPDFRTSCECS